ncbi:G2/mitotic-specific cyclin S13-7-like isoform X2 [Asparagus officinalis]|uniref:G2/mitotic-specific cyclin S13-7-like isoform X2 n=1 Tax=Asparagus officinalis TaxID=4686 RepID=UPI00098E5648|nr:G2/mitotic-specific cyclin S13-7-like isoform X2 [Asparagus officinalis]
MATKNQVTVPHHQQKTEGGAVVPKGKQKNAADGKHRRALGDIGNLVPAGAPPAAEAKPQHQISRPITGNFGAQLLANAQKKAQIRETKPKVSVKPKPAEVIIEISPDSDEVTKKRSSRKKVHTMTSVLTARSKAASGINHKLIEPIPDIDASDAGDQLAVVDYIEEIYKFYKISENLSRPGDYMESQMEINAKMRAILADWLIEVHHKFELMPESLYLTFYIIDRYLSMKKVLRRELQLVGVSSMLIACKYEEIWAPEVNDFICISDRAYSREQVLTMEKEILNVLEWSLTVPTPYMFLVRFLKAAMADKEMEHMVFFLAELGLMQYSMIKYRPSMVAASAVYAARCVLKKSPLWTETLKRHTGFSDAQLFDCVQILVRCHAEAPQDKLKFVYKKYSSVELGAVALNPPAMQLIEQLKALDLN